MKKELEKKFKLAYEETLIKINEQIEIAKAAIDEAEKISEGTGIPFRSKITPLYMTYRPTSFDVIWGNSSEESEESDSEESEESEAEEFDEELDEEERFYDLTNGDFYTLPEYDGWEHSAICN